MIGPLLILVSWLLLRLEHKPLSVLGFDKPAQRAVECVAGLLLAGGFAAVKFGLIARFSGFQWLANPGYGLEQGLKGFRWTLNSVLYEELLFRGYLLYKAIQYLGTGKACFLSAAAFGVYHWFTYKLFGAPLAMTYVFLMTGAFGLMFAYAFVRSGSVFLPIALHLGWNLVAIVVFSQGALGAQWLVPGTASPPRLDAAQAVLVNIVLPVGMLVLVFRVLLRKVGRDQSSPQA